jgi:hypothetical protein
MATSIQRTRAKLKLPRYEVPRLVTYVRSIVQSMTGSVWFPSPQPPLAAIDAALGALDTAQTATLTRAKGTTEVRDEKKLALVSLLQQLLSYIQATADANPENAASIIESAGIFVERSRPSSARVFTATPGGVSGTVVLSVPRAARGAAYEWAYSLDAGMTWTDLPVTVKASTTITGLPRGVQALFRYRPVTTTGARLGADVVARGVSANGCCSLVPARCCRTMLRMVIEGFEDCDAKSVALVSTRRSR